MGEYYIPSVFTGEFQRWTEYQRRVDSTTMVLITASSPVVSSNEPRGSTVTDHRQRHDDSSSFVKNKIKNWRLKTFVDKRLFILNHRGMMPVYASCWCLLHYRHRSSCPPQKKTILEDSNDAVVSLRICSNSRVITSLVTSGNVLTTSRTSWPSSILFSTQQNTINDRSSCVCVCVLGIWRKL